jgi:hypothetical protein
MLTKYLCLDDDADTVKPIVQKSEHRSNSMMKYDN